MITQSWIRSIIRGIRGPDRGGLRALLIRLLSPYLSPAGRSRGTHESIVWELRNCGAVQDGACLAAENPGKWLMCVCTWCPWSCEATASIQFLQRSTMFWVLVCVFVTLPAGCMASSHITGIALRSNFGCYWRILWRESECDDCRSLGDSLVQTSNWWILCQVPSKCVRSLKKPAKVWRGGLWHRILARPKHRAEWMAGLVVPSMALLMIWPIRPNMAGTINDLDHKATCSSVVVL